jgi:uncharacterized protein (UPF0248 family)
MIPIQELLNKVRYSPEENPEDYVLFYYDRIEDKLMRLGLAEIKKIEDNFLVLMKEGKRINLPLHRIRKVKKKGKIIWERPIR